MNDGVLSVIACAPSPWYVCGNAGTNAFCAGAAGFEMSTLKKPPRWHAASPGFSSGDHDMR